MVADTSALFAILAKEPDAQAFVEAIEEAPARRISALSAYELSVAIMRRFGVTAAAAVDLFLRRGGFEIVPFDERARSDASAAYARFGKGNHPARLNLADCAAYALAQSLDEPLLFKGDDFTKTDVRVAL